MATTWSRYLAVVLLGAGLAGCAGNPAVTRAGGETGLADRFTRLLDGQCRLPEGLDPVGQREARLLRAEWLLAILTRYGNARIESYSGDRQADAAMLLTRVRQAMVVLGQARADVARDPNQFELYRADLIMALLNTARTAIEPSLRTVGGLVLRPDPGEGLDLLGNYFQDRLYAQAYASTCADFMAALAVPDKRGAVAPRIEEHLASQCDRLAGLSGLAASCQAPRGP